MKFPFLPFLDEQIHQQQVEQQTDDADRVFFRKLLKMGCFSAPRNVRSRPASQLAAVEIAKASVVASR